MPDNEWNPPNAPDLQEDFHRASQNEPAKEEEQEQPRQMVTAAELARLEEERHKLEPELHFTIVGTVEQDDHEQEREALEARIREARERLDSARQRLRKDFRSAR